jgi:hypothetical protein
MASIRWRAIVQNEAFFERFILQTSRIKGAGHISIKRSSNTNGVDKKRVICLKNRSEE